MKKRVLGVALCTMLFALCFSAQAQQPKKIPRIGLMTATGNSKSPGPQVEAFQQGLKDLGYIEGKNCFVEYRYESSGVAHRELVAELLQLKVDVLVVASLPAIRAAKDATNTIPIVIVTVQDPVASGYIDSLARPGGNITGLTRLTRELSGKRLELLIELVPTTSRVGIVWDAEGQSAAIGFKEYETAARFLKIGLQSLGVRKPKPDFAGAFRAAIKSRSNSIIVIRNPLITSHQEQIADLAIKNRLPSMNETSDFVESGGLASYSSSDADQFRRAAVYVEKILKGAKPGDLPVEQPTKFELIINLKTAKQIGLTIPPSVLARADKVIK
jgi:putative tryptophan/tyrosine transport system substrate-binding protein